jgi:hypothetical protein
MMATNTEKPLEASRKKKTKNKTSSSETMLGKGTSLP